MDSASRRIMSYDEHEDGWWEFIKHCFGGYLEHDILAHNS
jgi:hypothetical protein